MNILDNKFYNWLDTMADFVLLNILWILMCLPIVTIFPATSALFGVVRKWALKKEPPLLKTFFQLFKENFTQSILIGFIWLIIGFALYIDYHYLTSNILLKMIFVILITIFTITTIYLFPVMVHYKNNFIQLVKNSFYLSVFSPINLLLAILVIGSSYTIVSIFPFMILGIASITAYFLFTICYRTFRKAERILSK